jgi:hypothetical protein
MAIQSKVLLALLATGAAMAFAQGAWTVTISGKRATLEVVERNGRPFVDAELFAKAMGASITVDRTKKTIVVVPAAAGAASLNQVQGTTQLAGGDGVIGKTYTIGKGSPLNFTLRSAEYTKTRALIGQTAYVPEADEKLLILRFTVQNPQDREVSYTWGDLRFTAVDAQDVNREYVQAVGRDGTGEPIGLRLKPAQKLDVFTVVKVPAKGVVPKLIVTREKDAPVIRYDLRGVAKALPAPFADPSDATGATAIAEVPGQVGQYYPLGMFDAKVDSVTFTTDPLNKRAPTAGNRFLVATVTLKNMSGRDQSISWSTVRPELIDSDGEKVPYNQTALKASRDEAISGRLANGEVTTIRFFFQVPEGVTGQSLKLVEGRTHPLTVDIGSFK